MGSKVTYAQQWLKKLPLRWARNGAIFGALIVFVQIGGSASWGHLLSNWTMVGIFGLQMATVVGVFALVCWIIGLAARASLQLAMHLGPNVAVKHIIPKWIIGGIALCLLILLSDLVFDWRHIDHPFGKDLAGDIGYLLGILISGTVLGLITGLISRRGLSQAIKIDNEITSHAF
jgi:hypothetical protein